ncbi:hypothetical protein L9F63_000975, partial [Diploptera punctata]
NDVFLNRHRTPDHLPIFTNRNVARIERKRRTSHGKMFTFTVSLRAKPMFNSPLNSIFLIVKTDLYMGLQLIV